MQVLIRPPLLAGPPAGIAPEKGDAVHARINTRPDTAPFGIARAHREQPSRRQHVFQEAAHAFDRIGRHLALLRKHVTELRVIFVGELRIARLLDRHCVAPSSDEKSRHLGE